MTNRILILLLLINTIFTLSSECQSWPEYPVIGAQVFIEPGQTPEEIDRWFSLMEAHHMPVCRIRLFENYLKDEQGNWDFHLFDMAFDAAQRHNVKIFVTLFPSVSPDNVGGFKFPTDADHLERIATYIEKVVNHYKDHPAFYCWVLQNEPGSGGNKPETAFTGEKFNQWKTNQPKPDYDIDYLKANYDPENFHRDYETWFLGWIAEQVHRHDPGSHTHVNSHAIFDILSEYDFSAWRSFLTSHGASMHPGFHYGFFNREQYPLAMSANSDIVKAGAGHQPFWVTELQGGNNIYSAVYPLCPTKQEIAQWLWTNVGCGAEGIIFWCLNPRASAAEAGEWALITFQDEPSDRLAMAGKVAQTIKQYKNIFTNTVPVESDITIMYNQESMYIHQRKVAKFSGPVAARENGAVIKSSLAYYETLQELGVPAKWSEMDDFDWTKSNYNGEVIIMAHTLCIPSRHWPNIRNFVNKGGKLIATGLTGYFDEYEHCVMKTGFPLQDVFGGNISEFKIQSAYFDLSLDQPKINIPAHFWQGTIVPINTDPSTKTEGESLSVRNRFGDGEVLWIPSPLGLGAWHHDNEKLARLLQLELKEQISMLPVTFKKQEKQVLMKSMLTDEGLLVILINKSQHQRTIPLQTTSNDVSILFGNAGAYKKPEKSIHIDPEETLVLQLKYSK